MEINYNADLQSIIATSSTQQPISQQLVQQYKCVNAMIVEVTVQHSLVLRRYWKLTPEFNPPTRLLDSQRLAGNAMQIHCQSTNTQHALPSLPCKINLKHFTENEQVCSHNCDKLIPAETKKSAAGMNIICPLFKCEINYITKQHENQEWIRYKSCHRTVVSSIFVCCVFTLVVHDDQPANYMYI